MQIEKTSSYVCDCGEVFDLMLAGEYENDVKYTGRCKCGRLVTEWRTSKPLKRKTREEYEEEFCR